MNIIFYVIIFIIGAFIGSLCATIIERISKEKNISLHSYCTKCGQKLRSSHKIPILSYIFFKGKCKNCKKPIEVKYIILEIITALLFVVTAYTLDINVANIYTNNIISFIFIILYYTYIIIAVGLDLEKRTMPSKLLAYGVIISIIYMVYLCAKQNITIYTSCIYLILILIMVILNILYTKKRAQSSYIIDLITMLLIMLLFTQQLVCIIMIGGTLISIALYILIHKLQQSKSKLQKEVFNPNVKIVFIMGILNILTFLTLININK